jgi:alpha-ketoglutarate-dependent taurine dioxygenase
MMSELEDLSKLSPNKRRLFEMLLQESRSKSQSISQPVRRQIASELQPLSFAQHRIWFAEQLQSGSSIYNLTAGVELKGALAVIVLEQSFNEIIRRHEMLRSTFVTIEGNPAQIVNPSQPMSLPLVDLSGLSRQQQQEQASRLSDEAGQRPFILSQGPLMRLFLLRLDESEHLAAVVMHHITSDAWSMSLLVEEIAKLYTSLTFGKPSPIPDLPFQYADFANWQKEWLKGKALQEQLQYWKERLDRRPLQIELPLDRKRSDTQAYQSGFQLFMIPQELAEALQSLSRQEAATMFMTFLAAFNVLLYRYTKQGDLLVGTPIANRDLPEFEKLIGIFLDTVVVRAQVSPQLSFREFLGQIRQVALNAYAHKNLPFQRLVEELQPKRDKTLTPLVQVWFALQNVPAAKVKLPLLSMNPAPIRGSSSQFDLELLLYEKDGGFEGNFKYNANLFQVSTIAGMAELFKLLLNHIAQQPDASIGALIGILDEMDRRQKLMKQQNRQEFNRKKFSEVKPKTIQVSGMGLVKTDYLNSQKPFPLVVQPVADGVNLPGWASGNLQFIKTELAKHGAILFRGFDVESVSQFQRLVNSISPELMDYYERTVQRTEVEDKIYTASEYAADHPIPFHNEYSFAHVWPMKLWFYCDTPAPQGGESTVADCREVFNLVTPETREKFAQKGVMYVRNYGDGLDLSWQEVFQTKEKEVVEKYCQDAHIEVEWKNNNRLRTRQIRQGIAHHPTTGEPVWFNQATLFHVTSLDPVTRKSLLTIFKSEENLPRHAFYGDGTTIEESAIEDINQAYRQALVQLPLQKGDIMVIDNMLVAHGRSPFKGLRKLLVAMAEPFENPFI